MVNNSRLGLPFFALVVVSVLPAIFWRTLLSRTSRAYRIKIRLHGLTTSICSFLALLALAYGLFRMASGLSSGYYYLGAGVLSFLVLGAIAKPKMKLVHAVSHALREKDFQGVIDLSVAQPKLMDRFAYFPHNVAFCRGLLGNRTQALADLAGIVERWPDFFLSRQAVVSFILQEDPEAALSQSRELTEAMPKLLDPLKLHVRAQLRLGQSTQCQALLDKGMLLNSEDGQLLALRAESLGWLATNEAERDIAESKMQEALRFAPRDALALVAHARMAAIFDDEEAFENRLVQAKEAVLATPFAVLDREIQELEQEPRPWTRYPVS